MCVLCTASRKGGKQIAKLLTCQAQAGLMPFQSAGSAASVEAMSNLKNIRRFSAVPQPSSDSNNGKIDGYVLHPSTINPNILKAEYAVRGELYNKAVELAGQGRDIMYTNGKPRCSRW